MNETAEISMMADSHLSEEQMFELLDGNGAADGAQLHLEGCERCMADFVAIRESLDGFRVAAHGLAQAQFRPVMQVRRGFMSGMAAWSMGLAAAGVLLAASVTMVHRAGPTPQVQVGSVKAAPLESDEALLNSIDKDLSTSVPPSLEPLSVASADGAENASKQN